MRHWLTRILICLALGAVTTVAVAWGCAIASHPTARDAWRVPVGAKFADTPDELRIVADGFGRRSHIVVTTAPEDEPMEVSYSSYPLMGSAEMWSPPIQYDDPEVVDYTVYQPLDAIQVGLVLEAINAVPANSLISIGWDATQVHINDMSGWPVVALQSMQSYTQSPNATIRMGIRFRAESSPDQTDILPLRPILPGFLIDTLFYCALQFGLFFGVSAARRTLRTRRGRCPMCGYDLRGDLDAGCPECGWNRAEDES